MATKSSTKEISNEAHGGLSSHVIFSFLEIRFRDHVFLSPAKRPRRDS